MTKTDIGKIASLIEAYGETLKSVRGLHVTPHVLRPSSEQAIAAAEKKLGVTLPADVKSFLGRGLRGFEGARDDEPFATVGFDFLDAEGIVEQTEMMRDCAGDEDDHAAVIRNGVALTYSEPELVWSGETLYHFSFRNPLLEIAGSFSEFLEHYLASGCFSSHAFPALWKMVSSHVPISIPMDNNLWVIAYKKQFPQSWE